MRGKIAVFLLAATCGACGGIDSNQIAVTFDSNPPGATIYSNGENWGVAPVTRVWTFAQRQATASLPVTAKWISGASANVRLSFPVENFGTTRTYTFERPQGVAGLESDVQWAIHVQRTKAAKEAADKGTDCYMIGRILHCD